MRRNRTLATGLLAVAMVGLAACGEVQEAQESVQNAQEGLDKATTCARVVGAIGSAPDLSNPEQAAAEAQKRVDEINRVAQETADKTLAQNLEAVQASLQEVASGAVTPNEATAWVDKHVKATQAVLQACGGGAGG